MTWYDSLAKPSWTPAGSTIGAIWSVLYPIIILVFGYMIARVIGGTAPGGVLVPIALNAVSNIAFTPLFFRLQRLRLATLDILVVLGTIVWCMAVFWPHSPVASLALIPYLAWVSTATVLQISIARMNR